MEYRLNPNTGIIYSRDEYIVIENDWARYAPTGRFPIWEHLDPLPIETEQERERLQFIYSDYDEDAIKYHKGIGNVHTSPGEFDLFDNLFPTRNDVGRTHIPGNQEADQRGLNDQQTDI